MRFAATRSSIRAGLAGPADAGGVCAITRAGPTRSAAPTAMRVRNRRLPGSRVIPSFYSWHSHPSERFEPEHSTIDWCQPARVARWSHMVADPLVFRDLAYVFAAAVLGGALAWLTRQPLILGYVLGGILIGPFTPGPTVSD